MTPKEEKIYLKRYIEMIENKLNSRLYKRKAPKRVLINDWKNLADAKVRLKQLKNI